MARALRLRGSLGLMGWLLMVAMGLVAVVAGPQTARAAEIAVDTTADFTVTNNGNCTLPEAILAANLNAAQDSCPAGDDSPTDIVVLATDALYALPLAYADYTGDTGLPSIASTIVISGNNATISRASVDNFRLLHIAPTVGVLHLFDLTLSNGFLDNSAGSTPDNTGGAVINYGTLNLSNTRVVSNVAVVGGGGIANLAGNVLLENSYVLSNTSTVGGGILNLQGGTLNVNDSAIRYNIAVASAGGVMSMDSGSTTTLTNTDVYSNSVADTGGGSGGGLYATNDSTLTLVNSRVARNWAFDGGGIYGDDSLLHVTNSEIYSNSASSGAGILLVADATAWLTDTQTYSNTAESGAGGALVNNSRLSVLRGGFTHNVALGSDGGAIFGSNTARIRLTDTLLRRNRAIGNAPFDGNGGALGSNSNTVLLISGSELVENYANGNGGALDYTGSRVVITDTRILTNTAGRSGGAIYNDTNMFLSLTNSTLSGNVAQGNGGAIYNSAVLTVTDTLVRANKAMTQGGAIYQDAGSYVITDSVLLSNRAGENGGAITHGAGVGSVAQSCIVDNSTRAINHLGGTDMEAENNWWGAPNGPSGVGPGVGDSVDDDVDFTPFFTTPLLACPDRTALVSLDKQGSTFGNLLPGQPLNYQLTITNLATVDVYNLLLIDELPTGYSLLETKVAAPINFTGVGYALPLLAASEVVTIEFVGQIDTGLSSDQTLQNTAWLSHTLAAPATITVTNNVVVPKLTLHSITTRALEGSGDVTMTVTLSPTTPYATITAQAVTTDTYVSDDEASELAAAAVTELSFPPNASSQLVMVDVGDDETRTPRTIDVALQNPVNAQLGNPITATLAITDTDTVSMVVTIMVSTQQANGQVVVGDMITHTYLVTNTGSLPLRNVEGVDESLERSFSTSALAPQESQSWLFAMVVGVDDLPGPLVNTAVVTAREAEMDELLTASASASVAFGRIDLRLPRIGRQGDE